MKINKEELLEMLGRTDTVKNVERAYRQIMEEDRVLAVEVRHAKDRFERKSAAIKMYLDRMEHITGLTRESKLFWRLVAKTLKNQLNARRLLDEHEMDGELMNGFEEEPDAFTRGDV